VDAYNLRILILISFLYRGRRGRIRMVVGFTTLLDVPRLKYAEIHSEMVYFRKDRAGYLYD
jgi:hypothetical protein